MSRTRITKAATAKDYAVGRALIEEYAAALDVDLCFQNFSEEISNLPHMYGPPHGFLLLARANGAAVGCVGVRNQSGTTCEMKRLYVQPEHRGASLGRRLAESAIRNARRLGYARIVLDTLPGMTQAQSLYGSLGFREIEGCSRDPGHGVRYLARELAKR